MCVGLWVFLKMVFKKFIWQQYKNREMGRNSTSIRVKYLKAKKKRESDLKWGTGKS
jgi:hypothetical protein